MSKKVRIQEKYVDYSPPVVVFRSIELLIRYVPDEYLHGLGDITLTNSRALQSFRGKFWSEKRRLKPAECAGLYSDDRIILVVDHVLGAYPEISLLIPQFKTFILGEVLYHEIGHHIHRNEKPGYRDNREVVADEWRDKLMGAFLAKRYWYLGAFARRFKWVLNPLMARMARLDKED